MAQQKQASGENAPAKKKAAPKKTSAKKTPEKKGVSSTKRSVPRHPQTRASTPEERHYLIADAAYLIAEQRGFQGDAELDDWLQAEAAIDARILEDV